MTLRHLVPAVAIWALKERRQGGETSTAGLSRRLRVAAEQLGPTYIKLGQIISSGDGLFPPSLVTEFGRCRDRVPPQEFALVLEILADDLHTERRQIASVDPDPIAAASIAQVHRAVLSDGTTAVVKIQRKGIEAQVAADLAVMSWLAPFLIGRIPVAALANPPVLVETFAETILDELDFRLEADSMMSVAEMFDELDHDGFVVPRPHTELVTQRVLVMEELAGYAFDDTDGLLDAGLDTTEILQTSMTGFLEGAFIHGIFHGDLHGGNLFIQDDGRVALLDHGITGRLDDAGRRAFLQLLVSGTMNDPHGQVRALRDLGALPRDTDIEAVVSDLGLDRPPVDPLSLDQAALVDEFSRIIKALLGYGARLPKPLMLFAKNLVFLDGAIGRLAPDLDLIAEVARIATYFAERHGTTIAEQLGVGPDDWDLDLAGVKAGFGLDDGVDTHTYAELAERRDLIRRRLAGRSG